MKRKLLTALILVMCLCALTMLSSCDAILDIIFGPSTPPKPTPPDDTHTHQLQQQTLDGDNCSGRDDVTYYECAECGKCYLDNKGEQLVDKDTLGAGHLYVLKNSDTEHFRECALCNTVQDGSREAHQLGDWLYNSQQHYKQCSVCDILLQHGDHDESGTCSVCGRRGDYTAMCNNRYGYEQLATLGDRSKYMQALYNKIDEVVVETHNNADIDAKQGTFDENGNEVNGYYITVSPDFAVTPDDVYITMASYRHDNPLYYWIGRYLGGDTKNIQISVVDEYAKGSARIDQNNKIYDEIDKYLSYVSAETDIYTITLALHDKIIENINYAYDNDGEPETAHWAHSIAGVFDNKLAVCEGYAKSFQLLLNACGIENAYVIGTSQKVGHAWNLVKLDNKQWYWYDLTWDDQPYVGRGIIHNYFCKSADEFDDHTVNTDKNVSNYLYDIPNVATEPYDTEGLELGETFTLDGFTYQYVGYNRVSVYKCLSVGADGLVTIPSTVEEWGVTYKVAEIASEAFVNYTRDKDNKIVSKVSPLVTKIVIPETVDLIYNESFIECKTLVTVEFVDANGWLRYGMTNQAPVYKQVNSQQLSMELPARILLQELCYDTATPRYYVWIKG